MNKLKIQVTQIENGFVVALPPTPSRIQPRTQEEAAAMMEPRVIYCEDYLAVCVALKKAWPVEAVQSGN